MEDDPAAAAAAAAGITDAVIANLVDKGKELSKGRKKRPIPATLAAAADVATYVSTSSGSPHATKSPGLLCVDLCPSNDSVTVSGGNDKEVVLFDHAKGQVLRTLAGHGKKVTTAVFHPEFGGGKALVLTGSADKTVKLWSTGADFSGDACSTVSALLCVRLCLRLSVPAAVPAPVPAPLFPVLPDSTPASLFTLWARPRSLGPFLVAPLCRWAGSAAR